MPKSKKNRKRKNTVPEPSPSDERVKFSFRYYDTSNKYCVSCWDKKFIIGALRILQDVSNKTYGELYGGRSTYHFHPVHWEQTIEKNGFPYEKANDLDAFQFALVGVNSGLARVFGALHRNIFYIVWFDLNHQIWPSFKAHT